MATSNEPPCATSNEFPYVRHTGTLIWKNRVVKYPVVKIPGKMGIMVHRYLPAAILLIVRKPSGKEQPCGVPQAGISSDNSRDSCQFLWKTGS